MTTYTLKTPITKPDGTVLTEVEVPSMVKVKAIKAAEKARASGGDIDAGIALLAAATNLPTSVVEDMGMTDFTALSEMIADFLPKPPQAA